MEIRQLSIEKAYSVLGASRRLSSASPITDLAGSKCSGRCMTVQPVGGKIANKVMFANYAGVEYVSNCKTRQ